MAQEKDPTEVGRVSHDHGEDLRRRYPTEGCLLSPLTGKKERTKYSVAFFFLAYLTREVVDQNLRSQGFYIHRPVQ